MSFRPKINSEIQIGQSNYRFAEHPSAKNMPYGQTGRRATVYQIINESGAKFALKVFANAFRSPYIAAAAQRLKLFSTTPGLGVCKREVLIPENYPELLMKYPDLAYAVLMPWVQGETWQEFILSRRALVPQATYSLAGQMVVLLGGMEQRGLAHCDISGPNVMIDFSSLSTSSPGIVSSVALVDVEEMYGPGFDQPEKLPAGTPGYDHLCAGQGLWSLDADRFAGAVILTEILTRSDDRIRRISFQEQYFDPGEMQENTDRYQLVVQVLQEQGNPQAAELFSQAWFSQTLSDCPTFSDWYFAIQRRAEVPSGPRLVSSFGWKPEPIESFPPSRPSLEQLKPQLAKIASEGDWIGLVALTEGILQYAPDDPEALKLKLRAEHFLNAAMIINGLWQTASRSGKVEDWERCLQNIAQTQSQARPSKKYEQLRQQAEKEHQLALKESARVRKVSNQHIPVTLKSSHARPKQNDSPGEPKIIQALRQRLISSNISRRKLLIGLALLLGLVLFSGLGVFAFQAASSSSLEVEAVAADTGNPLPAVNVVFQSGTRSYSPTPGNQGTFTFSHLPAGQGILTVSLAGYASKSKSVQITTGTANDEKVEMTLTGARIHGQIKNIANSLPIKGVSVKAAGVNNQQIRCAVPGCTVSTNSDGLYELILLDPGQVVISFTAPLYQTAILSSIIVNLGQNEKKDWDLTQK